MAGHRRGVYDSEALARRGKNRKIRRLHYPPSEGYLSSTRKHPRLRVGVDFAEEYSAGGGVRDTDNVGLDGGNTAVRGRVAGCGGSPTLRTSDDGRVRQESRSLRDCIFLQVKFGAAYLIVTAI